MKTFAKKLELVNGLSLDQVLRKVVSFRKQPARSLGPYRRRDANLDLQKVDIPFSVQRPHCPEEIEK